MLERVRMSLDDGEERAWARLLLSCYVERSDERGKLGRSSGSMGRHLALSAC